MQDNQAFQQMLLSAKERICVHAPEEIAKKSGAVFPFLPHYPIWLKVWFADDEFEASGKLLVSRSTEHYLTIEDAVTVGELLLSKLKDILDET